MRISLKTFVPLGLAFGLLLIGLYVVFGSQVNTVQASVLSSDAAISRALTYAQDDGFFGGLTGEPTQIFGKVITQEEAMTIVTGHPLPPDAPRPQESQKSVWLVVFVGSLLERPNSPAGSGKEAITYTHIVEVIDAVTGDPIVERMFGPKMSLDTSNLPELSQPRGTDIEIPTLMVETTVPIATEQAAPTASP